MTAINWAEYFDDNDNVYYEGASPFTTEPDGAPDIYFRIRQRLRSGVVEWYADHDAELGGETGETWPSFYMAQEACEKVYSQIVATESEAELCAEIDK